MKQRFFRALKWLEARLIDVGSACPTLIQYYWLDSGKEPTFVDAAIEFAKESDIPFVSDRAWRKKISGKHRHIANIEKKFGRSIHSLVFTVASHRGCVESIANRFNLTVNETMTYLDEVDKESKRMRGVCDEDHRFFRELPFRLPLPVTQRELEAFISKHRDAPEKVFDFLIEKNLRLLRKFCVKTRVHSSSIYDRGDLIQDGFLGLHRAARKWDLDREPRSKFASFACMCISQSFQYCRGVWSNRSGRPTRLNKKGGKLAKEIRSFVESFEVTHERSIRPEDVASRFEVSISTAHLFLGGPKSVTTLNQQKNVLGNLSDTSQTQRERDETQDQQTFVANSMKQWLNILDYRSRKIIELRYGINTDKPLTLEETSKIFNITREYVRQIEAKAIDKLSRRFKNSKNEEKFW